MAPVTARTCHWYVMLEPIVVGLRHRPGASRDPHRSGHRRDAYRARDQERRQRG